MQIHFASQFVFICHSGRVSYDLFLSCFILDRLLSVKDSYGPESSARTSRTFGRSNDKIGVHLNMQINFAFQLVFICHSGRVSYNFFLS